MSLKSKELRKKTFEFMCMVKPKVLIGGKVRRKEFFPTLKLDLNKAGKILRHFKVEMPQAPAGLGDDLATRWRVLKTFELAIKASLEFVFKAKGDDYPKGFLPAQVVSATLGTSAEELDRNERMKTRMIEGEPEIPEKENLEPQQPKVKEYVPLSEDQKKSSQPEPRPSKDEPPHFESIAEIAEEFENIYGMKTVSFQRTTEQKELWERVEAMDKEMFEDLMSFLSGINEKASEVSIVLPVDPKGGKVKRVTLEKIIIDAFNQNPFLFIGGFESEGHTMALSLSRATIEELVQTTRGTLALVTLESGESITMNLKDLRPMIAVDERSYFWENYRRDMLVFFFHELLHLYAPGTFQEEYKIRSYTGIQTPTGMGVEVERFESPRPYAVEIVDELDRLGLLAEEWKNKKPSLINSDGTIDWVRYQLQAKKAAEIEEK